MLELLIKPIGWLPLAWMHRLGAALGVLGYACGVGYRRKIRDNLRQAGLDEKALLPAVKRHAGMQALETFWVWSRSNADLLDYIDVDASSREALDTVLAQGRSVIVMTPHVGCFEVVPVWAYEHCLRPAGKTMTVLYREPKMACLRQFVAAARLRPGMDPAPADLSGVRKIVKAMRSGGVLGCLPDQVPGRGEGVWVPFFGRLAYTMVFPVRMAAQFNAACFVACARRVPGRGWTIGLRPIEEPMTGNPAHDAATMTREIEKAILSAPEQYIWNYNRYKVPSGARVPSESENNSEAVTK